MEPDVLDPDRTGLGEFEGLDIDLDELRRLAGGGRNSGDELCRNALGAGFERLGQVQGDERALASGQLGQPSAQAGPVRLGQIEVAAEVEEGGLADAPAFTAALDQAVGVVDLAGATGGWWCDG